MVRRNVALDGQARLALRPSKKSIRRMIETIHELTIRSGAWQRDHRAGGQVEPRGTRLGELFPGWLSH
jgi:hypothetical protein